MCDSRWRWRWCWCWCWAAGSHWSHWNYWNYRNDWNDWNGWNGWKRDSAVAVAVAFGLCSTPDIGVNSELRSARVDEIDRCAALSSYSLQRNAV